MTDDDLRLAVLSGERAATPATPATALRWPTSATTWLSGTPRTRTGRISSSPGTNGGCSYRM